MLQNDKTKQQNKLSEANDVWKQKGECDTMRQINLDYQMTEWNNIFQVFGSLKMPNTD